MAKRIIGIILLIVLCGALIASCKKQEEETKAPNDYIDYHVETLFGFTREKIDSDPQDSGLKASFVENCRTKFVSYLYIDPETGDREYRYDSTCPRQVWHIIEDQDSLEEFFDTPPEVDFERQMVVLTFSTIGFDADFSFQRVTFKDNVLTFFELKQSVSRSSRKTVMLQALFGYKMDRMDDVAKVEVVFTNW